MLVGSLTHGSEPTKNPPYGLSGGGLARNPVP
jgi:hypothetical protein